MAGEDPKNRPANDKAGQRVYQGVNAFSTVADLSVSLVGGTLVGGFLGWLLDRWMHRDFVFTLILGFIGFAIGISIVIRKFVQTQNRPKQ